MPSAPAVPLPAEGREPCCHARGTLSPSCRNAIWPLKKSLGALLGLPGKGWVLPCRRQLGLHLHLTGSFDIASLLGKSTSQENKFLSLKCKAEESFTVFRTNTRTGNNSGLYSCLAHCFGFHFPFSSQMSCFSR